MRYRVLTATHHPLAEQEQQMHDTTDEAPSKTRITKERLRAWEACATGFRWFVEKFPQGAEFAEVYAALVADKRHGDADWLVEHVLAELDDTVERVRQILMLANAATTGHWAIAASLGIGARAKAGAGGAIMLAGRDDTGRLLHVFASMVGQNGIKPDTWYELDEAGKPIEVPGAPA